MQAWGGLQALLAPLAANAFESLESPALAVDVQAVEAHLGRPLPAEFKSLLALHDGQRAAGPLPWELAPLHERLMTWKWLNRGGFPREWWSPDWFPILSNGSGDYLVLDLSQDPAPLIEYRHDSPFRPVLASSLSAWILQVQDALQSGRLFGITDAGRFVGFASSLPSEDGLDVLVFSQES
jgi:cell wall assembly regulator SMI1